MPFVGSVALGLVVLGCATKPGQPPSDATHAAPPEPRAEASFPRGAALAVENCPLAVELSVPEPRSWTRSGRGETFRLEHAPTATTLELRHWATRRLVTVAECEAELSTRDPAARARASEFLSIEPVASAEFRPGNDYRGTVTSRVAPLRDGRLGGWVHAVASGLGHCLSFDAQTSARQGAEDELARRLSVLTDEVAASLRLRDITQRVERTTP